ncbi:hypothetical protein GCM10010392_62870 [Streptomyces clavifer]|nr:hypothetical protein GCM10010392_62870 [Streptomyces clavifer]
MVDHPACGAGVVAGQELAGHGEPRAYPEAVETVIVALAARTLSQPMAGRGAVGHQQVQQFMTSPHPRYEADDSVPVQAPNRDAGPPRTRSSP